MKHRLLFLAALACAALLAACGPTGDSPGREAGQTTLEARETPPAEDTEPTAEAESTEVEVSTFATDLEAPWDVAFLPEGDALVTERDSGRLLRIGPEGDAEEVRTLPSDANGEGGLLGVALSPDFEQDNLVYAYYTTAEDNRVVRFPLDEPGAEPEPILTGIPVASFHNGGRIAFGPDGMLYVGTGDAGDTASSQAPEALGGKILRLQPDGSIPEDNPFGPQNPAYSYGHRNVQGLAWDADGQLYATEFGQDTWDEVNRIEPGENYGWPEVEGEGGEPDFVDPVAVFTTDEASPSGAAILVDGAIPQWEGDFFMAALRGERLWRLELDEGGNVSGREELLSGEAGRLRHVAQAPDGSLWVLTSNRDGRGSPVEGDDRILRLAPADG